MCRGEGGGGEKSWGEGGCKGGETSGRGGWVISHPYRSAARRARVASRLRWRRTEIYTHTHTHRIDRSDGTAGRARAHTHPLTPWQRRAGSTPEEGGCRRSAERQRSTGGWRSKAKEKTPPRKRRRRRLDGRGGDLCSRSPHTSLSGSRLSAHEEKRGRGETRSRLLLWIYSFIYLSILV